MVRPDQGQYPISQYFGGNPQIYARFNLAGHNGWDLACPAGTRLIAPHQGKVVEIGDDPEGYGVYVKIESHLEGSILGHNQQILVERGQYVDEGQAIALSDNTGFSSGPHSHWGYYRLPRNRTNGYLGYIDPTPYLEHGIMDLMIPAYLQTLLQENNLDLSHESAIRDFFQKARQYDSLLKDKENCETQVRTLQEELKIAREKPVEPVLTVDLAQVTLQDLLIAVIKKIIP